MAKKSNVVYVFSDQHRAEATGFRGNADVITPHLDQLAKESISFTTAVAGIPVCGPSRACLITGQYPLTHGVFVNDVCLSNNAVSIADAYNQAGYDTAYIGKWHLDGHGRSAFIPGDRRQGFHYWRVLECSHNYNHSFYYGDEPQKLQWEGYDAEAQTRCAQDYIRNHSRDRPFLLMLSYGPPHDPYHTAPEKMKKLYDPEKLALRPNVPEDVEQATRVDLSGYYSHVTALDAMVGELLETLKETGMDEDTLFIYTSDHGDMLGSHGMRRKQKPWDESILVPFLLRYPALFGREGREVRMPVNTPDIMPTLLGICGIEIPATVEGTNYAPFLKGEEPLNVEAALIQCIHPFGEFNKGAGGREYRGIRTERYTYVRDLGGPWLLYDNWLDPYQMNNLCNTEDAGVLQRECDEILNRLLTERKDSFQSGNYYIDLWGYTTDDTGTVPYQN